MEREQKERGDRFSTNFPEYGVSVVNHGARV